MPLSLCSSSLLLADPFSRCDGGPILRVTCSPAPVLFLSNAPRGPQCDGSAAARGGRRGRKQSGGAALARVLVDATSRKQFGGGAPPIADYQWLNARARAEAALAAVRSSGGDDAERARRRAEAEHAAWLAAFHK